MITSKQNQFIKRLKKLNSDRRYRRKEGLFIAEGIHLVEEAISSACNIQSFIFTSDFLKHSLAGDLVNKIRQEHIETVEVTKECYLSFSHLKSPEGVCVLVDNKGHVAKDDILKHKLLLIIDEVQDPGNMGALIRTGEAAGFDAVLLIDACADIYHPAVLRASMGSVFRMDIIRLSFDECCNVLINSAHVLVAAVADGVSDFREVEFNEPLALIVGSEGRGVSTQFLDMADVTVKIPMAGNIESLNAGVAGALMMYEIARKTERI
jgi:TrmH family RNA methyltransferase